MSSYEPDPQTAKLFARHKQATETIRTTKKPVTQAVEDAIRNGATSPQLVELTGLTGQTIRNIAERLGIDIRLKAPTVGREVEARRAASEHAPPAPALRPTDIALRHVGDLTTKQLASLVERAFQKAVTPQLDKLLTGAAAEGGDRAVVEAALEAKLLTAVDLQLAE